MAKTTICAFCGKELTKGLFKGDAYSVVLGMKIIPCCEDCQEKYKHAIKRNEKRFDYKLSNIAKTTKKKLTEKEHVELFVQYLAEEEEYVNKNGDVILDYTLNGFSYNKDGYFSVREYGKGFVNSDVGGKSMLKSVKKSQKDTGCTAFTKDDITKIEYAKIGSGSFNGLFQQIFSFAIRLNDETVMTYKPCITRMVSYGGGFGFGYQKNAEKRLVRIINEFQKEIGTDFPVVKVKKI